MPRYAKYATTVIGAYSVPDRYEALDRLVAARQLPAAAMADARFRAGKAAILDQEVAGVDVITGGEMHRRTHNRHAPRNAMLNHFWQKIPAFQGDVRPKPARLVIPTSSIRRPRAGSESPTRSTSAWPTSSPWFPRWRASRSKSP